MNFAPTLHLTQLVISSLAVAGLVLPVLAVLVAVAPFLVAKVIDRFRPDPDGVYIPRRLVVRSRILAITCVVTGVLALVAVQPRYFRRAPSAVPARVEGGDFALRESIAPDVKALIDSVPCAGVVVGVVLPTGNQVFGFGRRSLLGNAEPDGETVFEIGDLTQVFTASLLARMAERDVVRLDQPVRSLLADTVSVPFVDGRDIELWHLATNSSGLPKLASNPASPVLGLLPPFARAGRSQSTKGLYDLISSLQITRAPGTNVSPSDLGMGLLGHALERASKTSYDAALQREVCRPLGLRDTRVRLTPDMRKRLAAGMTMGTGTYQGWYVASPAQRWSTGPISGAEDLYSTADDLLVFMRAHLAGFPMAGALGETRRPRLHVQGRPDVGLGWFIEPTTGGDPVVWQHGTTGTSRSYIAFLEHRGIGVVVLSNVPINTDLLGMRILNRLLGPGA